MNTVPRFPSGAPRGPWWSLRTVAAAVAAAAVARSLARRVRAWRAPASVSAPDAERAPETETARPAELPARRRFLQRITLAAGALVAALLAAPFASFLFRTPEATRVRVWRRVGSAADFAVGGTVRVTYLDATPLPWAGFAAESAAWLRRESETEFVAFTLYCTHTGCPVRWVETAELFMCPCHGGVFYRDGAVAAGPPPVPLTRYPVRVRDGAVEILTTPIPGRL